MRPVGKKSLYAVTTVLVLTAFFLSGVYVGYLNRQQVEQPAQVNLAPFWRTWNLINQKYVPANGSSTPVTDQDKVWGAISGLVDSLGDPYSVFLPPAQAEIFEGDIKGNFEGVGMEIGVREGVLTVVAPLKGSPAQAAGILAGDKIIEIDDSDTAGMTVEEAVSLIRGPQGTTVKFTIAREKEKALLEITVVRDVINIPTVETELRPDGIFIIRIFNFSGVSHVLFRGALREFVDANTDKLIIDLRENPGGFLGAAVDMASWFLPAGKVVVRESSGPDNPEKLHRSAGYDVFNDQLKMIILIDQGTASAAEILAGALSEYGRAKLVGEKTFGKGSVQELIDLGDDGSLKITVARWLTPNGVSISAGGLTPDVEVEVTKEEIESGRDPILEKAVELIK